MNPQAVIDFWFDELTSKQWFAKSDALDNTIKTRFSDILVAKLLCLISSHEMSIATRRWHLVRTLWRWCWRRRRLPVVLIKV